MLADVRKTIATYIKEDNEDNVVFIENASDGFNAVTKGFDWSEGDKILRTSISYSMV